MGIKSKEARNKSLAVASTKDSSQRHLNLT